MKAKKVTQPANQPITLDEAKAHCRVTFADDDALIEQLIKAATSEMETRLQRTLCDSTWSITLDNLPDGGIRLPHPPLLQVNSVVYFSEAGTQLTLSSDDYIVDTASEPGWIVPAPNKEWPATQSGRINSVTVTYRAGYRLGGTSHEQRDAVPRDIRAYLLIRVATMYENREGIVTGTIVSNVTALDSLWQPYRVIEA